jgi:cation diffusion facilitator CzcD-associated flavoprotein CzcO
MPSAPPAPPSRPDTARRGASGPVVDRRDRVLVVGAGSSGLTAAKNLRERGAAVDVVEREDDVGGNWNAAAASSRVYASTHMISSKPFTQFPDFPMPDDDPDYLHHEQVHRYLRRYASHFGLREVIRFRTEVAACTPVADGGWEVVLRTPAGDERCHYGTLVVANGHNWYPKQPHYPGQGSFTGELLHAAEYHSSDRFAGKRVVVVGAGNTGCDLAVEAAQRAAAAYHSTRRAYWYAPKYAFGRPADQVSDVIFSLRLPTRVTQALFQATARVVVGRYERFGLPTPDHRFLETHPIVNQQLLYHIGHGDLTPVPDVARFEGDAVVFTDGRRVTADVVVFATGYLIRFPFLPDDALPGEPGRPELFRNVFHPDRDDLAVIGLIQPDSGQFCLVHWQAVMLATFLALRQADPAAARRYLDDNRDRVRERSQGGVELVDSTRHYVEVEHADYVRVLQREIRDLERRLTHVRRPVPVS